MKVFKKYTTSILLALLMFVFASSVLLTGCAKDTRLTVSTNAVFPPFEYLDNKGKIAGIDMDVAQYFATQMGVGLHIQDLPFESVIASVTSGQSDIAMAGLTVSESRKKVVDFSIPYFESSQMIVARIDDTRVDDLHGDDSLGSLLSVLQGKNIGVMGGFTGQFFVDGDADWDFDGIQQAKSVQYDSGAAALIDLTNGSNKIDYLIIDGVVAQNLVKANSNIVKLVDVRLTDEQNAYAVKKGNTKLLDNINTILQDMKENGKLDEIIAKYYGVGA